MREWYVTQALENGWSRPTLEKYIRQNLYQSQSLPSNKASNFLVGRQYPIEIDDETCFIDILMYHLKLRAFVVCELKAKKFKPENEWLQAIDKLIPDQPCPSHLLKKAIVLNE